jgi:hypothetical protein
LPAVPPSSCSRRCWVPPAARRGPWSQARPCPCSLSASAPWCRRPSPRLSLARFLESPGKEEGRIQLWLRFNREARGIEAGAKDFLETLTQLTAQASTDVIYSHERAQLEAEALSAQQEIEELVDARAELLEEQGKVDPDHAILGGELAPPWSPDGVLDRESLKGLVRARPGSSGTSGPELDRALGRLASVERRLDAVEHQLLPSAEESLGSALLGLSAGEASMLEVVHGLHFLKHQQRLRLELRVHRELLLMELARQAGCRVDQLPWVYSPVAG